MGVSISVQAFSGKGSAEFQKHFKAVQFCVENGLSYPAETSEFFKGKVQGDSLEDMSKDHVVAMIKDGIQVPMKISSGLMGDKDADRIIINVSDIPKEADTIHIFLR